MTEVNNQNFNQKDEFLFSYGQFNPTALEADIKTEFIDFNNTIQIDGWAEQSEFYPDIKPKLYLFCSPTRFGGTVQTDLQNDRYEVFTNISLDNLHGELECRFIIYNDDYDILQQSDLFKIKIDNELGEDFPNVLWLDFSEHYPPLENCYWYIHADPDHDLTIAFNSGKSNFREAIELNDFGDNFRDEFLRHFRVIYVTSLTMTTEQLEGDRLSELLIPENQYHYTIISQLLSYEGLDEDPWLRYAILNQEVSGVRRFFDKLLVEEMRLDEN